MFCDDVLDGAVLEVVLAKPAILLSDNGRLSRATPANTPVSHAFLYTMILEQLVSEFTCWPVIIWLPPSIVLLPVFVPNCEPVFSEDVQSLSLRLGLTIGGCVTVAKSVATYRR